MNSLTATIIDGRRIAADIDAETSSIIESVPGTDRRPAMAVVSVGHDAAAESYSRQKQRIAAKLDIGYRSVNMEEGESEEHIASAVRTLSDDKGVDAVLVHSPLPRGLDARRILDCIAPLKDVDCASTYSMGRMYSGMTVHPPATPQAVIEVMVRSGFGPAGKHVVIVGRSNVVGKPLANLLLQKGEMGDATITVCHSRTKELEIHTRRAEILVSAVGRPGAVTGKMVTPGTFVIDVGINSVPSPTSKSGFRIVGDVDFESVSEKALAITPVPGGVGPVTTSVLLRNVARAFVEHRRLSHD